MATLIFTAVGTALGGPIGGAIGAILGQRIDAEVFKPKGRQGPRLGELAVQTSSYGTAVPKIFGTMRVAGTVIWATDLREARSTDGGGKGKPKTTNYSYSASFAVALSGRQIRGVGRIWADGKLLRGAAGDFKSATQYRLYAGSEDQEPDPLIASVEGIGQTPAFRGIAYAMFEDFQLADYGNRIPSLTFEVEADAGPVSVGAVAEELSGRAIRDGETPMLSGYAASGDSVRGAIEALGDIVTLSLTEGDEGLIMMPAAAVAPLLSRVETGTGTMGAGGLGEMRRQAAGTVAAAVSIAYYDPARDYQTGLQRATRGGPALRSDLRSLPAALGAGAAKALAEHRLATLWSGRATGEVHLPWRLSGIRPGNHVRIEGQTGLWRVARWTLDRMVVTLTLVQTPSVALAAELTASSGRPIGSVDQQHGPTTLFLLDLPLGGEQIPSHPHLLVAASGQQAGWRQAELMVSYDGGTRWDAAGITAAPAVMGTALTALPAGGSALFDTSSNVEIQLLHDAMWLQGRSDAALADGANLALIGNELIQFGAAEPLGERRFRLRRLLRGRRATEWTAAAHVSGECFLLIEQHSLTVIEPPVTALGAEARLIGSGIGDLPAGARVSAPITGEALRPPSPVHLRAARAANGDIAINWVRRSRNGWAWLSGGDTPLGEETETYRLVLAGNGFERTMILQQSGHFYTIAAQAADGLAGPLSISVAQIGTFATSREAHLTLD